MTSQREQEIINLSKKKWEWMSAKDVESLASLFHDEAVFVHMSRTMTKEAELEVIRTGGIHYRDVDIQEVSVRFVSDSTAVLLNSIVLGAVVRDQEVSNPFVVTEVYVQHCDGWQLGTMAFTKTNRHPRPGD